MLVTSKDGAHRMQTFDGASGGVQYTPVAQGNPVPLDFHSHQGYPGYRPFRSVQVVPVSRGHLGAQGDPPSAQNKAPTAGTQQG